MQKNHRLAIAALATLFGTAATGAAVLQPAPAFADQGENNGHNQGNHGNQGNNERHGNNNDNEDNNDQQGHHDNGKHKGWNKHGGQYGSSSSLRGTVTSVNGNMLTVRLNNGQIVTVNDQNAANAGRVGAVGVGSTVRLSGAYGQDGVFYANAVSTGQYNGNGNGSQYGYNNGGNCNASSVYGLTQIAGYEKSGLSGSQFTLRQPLGNGIPWQVAGTDYTVLTSGACIENTLGTYGEHVTVWGRPTGDGRTIQAVRITG